MNKDQFHQYLNYPNQLDANSLLELDELVKEYPYFQAARMLYVKNLKNEENIRFNRQLKFAAASISNRQLLFGLLNRIRINNDGSFFPDIAHKTSHKINLQSQDGPVIADEKLITEGILSLDENPEQDLLPSGSDAPSGYDKSFYVKELERFIPIADLDLLLFDFPIDNSDILDFDFENKLPEIEDEQFKANTDKEIEETETGGLSSRDLIGDFIRKNPRMPKVVETAGEVDDISIESLKESDAFMTETLAEIYLKQGYYYRALQAYEKLSLKFPEKSAYFASQIQKIKELITNQ